MLHQNFQLQANSDNRGLQSQWMSKESQDSIRFLPCGCTRAKVPTAEKLSFLKLLRSCDLTRGDLP